MNKRASYRNTVDSLKAKTVVNTNGCWEWSGCVTEDGYGRTMHNNKSTTTHRVMYKLYHGSIPEGGHVLHKCDNPPCINPDHLRVGTHQENMNDMLERGRRASFAGEANASAKLNRGQVEEIRQLCKQGLIARHIAPIYNISIPTIYAIKNRRNWR